MADETRVWTVEISYRAIVTATGEADARWAASRLRSEITGDVMPEVTARPCVVVPLGWAGCAPCTTLPHDDPRREWTVDQWLTDAAARAVR